MKQSKISSLCEVTVSTLIGFIASVGMNYLVFPRYGFKPSFTDNLEIVLWFTILSIIRGYVVRRMWEARWWKFLFKKDAA